LVRIGFFPEQGVQPACYLHGNTTWASWIAEHSDRLDKVSDGGLSVTAEIFIRRTSGKTRIISILSFDPIERSAARGQAALYAVANALGLCGLRHE
jgi:hypothetical protein